MVKCNNYNEETGNCNYEHHNGSEAPCEDGSLLTCPYLDHVQEVMDGLRNTLGRPNTTKTNTDITRIQITLAISELDSLEAVFTDL